MDILTVLKFILAANCVVLTVAVILQARGGGLGAVLGGSGGESYRSKRGLEAVLYNVTIVSGVAFAALALAIAMLSA